MSGISISPLPLLRPWSFPKGETVERGSSKTKSPSCVASTGSMPAPVLKNPAGILPRFERKLWKRMHPRLDHTTCRRTRANCSRWSSLLCLGRHTVTGLLTTSGSQFQDWSATYRLLLSGTGIPGARDLSPSSSCSIARATAGAWRAVPVLVLDASRCCAVPASTTPGAAHIGDPLESFPDQLRTRPTLPPDLRLQRREQMAHSVWRSIAFFSSPTRHRNRS